MARWQEIKVLGVENAKYPIESIAVAMSSDPLPDGKSEKMVVEFCTLYDDKLFYNIELEVIDVQKNQKIRKMLPESL